MADTDRNTAKFNDQWFYYDIYFQDCQQLTADDMKSAQGRLKGAVKIIPDAIHQLVIEDDLLSWFPKGFMIFQNNFEALEGVETAQGRVPIVRHDGRDLLIVHIEPINSTDSGLEFKKEDWSLEYEFVIYDTEDLPSDNPSVKYKKLYFWDLRRQVLDEVHKEFSTFQIQAKTLQSLDESSVKIAESATLTKDPALNIADSLTDILSLLNSGNVVDGILSLMGLTSTVQNAVNPANGFDKILSRMTRIIADAASGKILNLKDDINGLISDTKALVTDTPATPKQASQGTVSSEGEALTGDAIKSLILQATEDFGLGVFSKDKWDNGSEKIFYTSPASFNSLEDLTYLLGRHVAANENDHCLFTLHRYTKEFQLIPFSDIFHFSTAGENPGAYQFEHFYLERFAGLNESSPGVSRAPEHGLAAAIAKGQNDPHAPTLGTQDTSIDVKIRQYGTITNYRFVDMAGADSAKAITSRPVFSYDFKTGTFNCEYKNNNIVHAKDVFKKRYVEKLYGKNKTPLFTLNQTRTKFKNIEPVFSTSKTKNMRLNDGLNKILWAAIYMNETIAFDVLGSTNRKAGHFVGVDKAEYMAYSPFESKFFGQWLTTNIKHVFTKNSYANQVLGVKIHSYQDLQIKEEIP